MIVRIERINEMSFCQKYKFLRKSPPRTGQKRRDEMEKLHAGLFFSSILAQSNSLPIHNWGRTQFK